MVLNFMRAFTILFHVGTGTALPRARRAGGGCVQGPIGVPWNGFVFLCKGGRHVVFTGVGFGLLINAGQIQMGRLARGGNIAVVDLVPPTVFHVVLQQFGSNFLVHVQHDSIVVATLQPTTVRLTAARGVLFLQQRTRGRRGTIFHKLLAFVPVVVAHLFNGP